MDKIPTIILCGGRGSRIADSYPTIPKPLVPVGGRPILWHIMKIYAASGFSDFVLALGWLGDEIRRFFLHYEALTRDFRIEFGHQARLQLLGSHPEQGWSVTCLDTGIETLTGGRVRRASEYCEGDTIMVTYGDSVGNIDVSDLLEHHRKHGRLATITAVQPPSRFGELTMAEDDRVSEFVEKPQTSTGSISGGYMVFEREAIEHYFPTDRDVMLEREPLAALAADGQLTAYEHRGFWQPMDTARERALLEDLWDTGQAPWKIWD